MGRGLYSPDFKSVSDHAASTLCSMHPIFMGLSLNNQNRLVTRCNSNWKRVLRFLQSIRGNMQMKKKERDRTIVANDLTVYSCGLSMFGDLAEWPEARRHCSALTDHAWWKGVSFTAQVIQVSASENNAAFLMRSGDVLTCGKNYLFGCGHLETDLPIYSPKHVEALETIPCKQVATGLYSTVFLTREGHVYTVGGRRRFSVRFRVGIRQCTKEQSTAPLLAVYVRSFTTATSLEILNHG